MLLSDYIFKTLLTELFVKSILYYEIKFKYYSKILELIIAIHDFS